LRHVFISYSRSGDGDFAQRVRAKLESRPFPVWQDVKLDAGETWQEEIDQAIRESLAVVVILSPRSVGSPYLNYEWAYALGAGRRVLPLLVGLDERELHARLQNLHFLRFTAETGPWSELIRSLDECAELDRPATVRLPAGAPPAVRKAAEQIDDPDPEARAAAIRTLGSMNDRSAQEVLAGALAHPTSDVRALAAKWLLQFGDARAVPQLIENRRSSRWDVVAEHDAHPHEVAVVGARGVPDLAGFLRDGDPDIRAWVSEILGGIGDPSAVPHVVPLLQDPDPSVRATAVRALGTMKDPAVIPLLESALRDQADGIRRAALEALIELRGGEAVECLLRALADRNAELRNRAVVRLGELKAAAAVPGLRALLTTERDEQTRKEIPRALGRIADPSAAPDLLAALADDGSSLVRSTAKSALQEFRGQEVVSGLIAALGDERARVRGDAADLLGELGDPGAVPALVELLDADPEAAIRERALRALAGIGDAAAVPALIARLAAERDPEQGFARKVVDVLETIGTPEARAAARAWRKERER
jgi:HEAT repeat protein